MCEVKACYVFSSLNALCGSQFCGFDGGGHGGVFLVRGGGGLHDLNIEYLWCKVKPSLPIS